MWLSDERKTQIMGVATEGKTHDELANVAKEVLEVLKTKELMLCDAKMVLNMVESVLRFAKLP